MRNAMIISSMLLLSAYQMSAQASNMPHGLAADHRVQVVQYDVNNVVPLYGHYGYQTQITFAKNEKVQSVSLGDSLAWQAVPVQNHLFLKPVAESKTNMTVLTNVHSYLFQLDSSPKTVKPTYQLSFHYPHESPQFWHEENSAANLDPMQVNWKYSFKGYKALVPESVFDNGQFTYFKFKSTNDRLPAVFMVDEHRNETLVNYHMQGDYLVVDNVGKQFALRDGKRITHIYNNLAIGDWRVIG